MKQFSMWISHPFSPQSIKTTNIWLVTQKLLLEILNLLAIFRYCTSRRHLYHPVLPYRTGGKLMFPLCPSWSDIQNKNECKCSDKDRVLHGTYCTPESIKPKEMEYKIVRIYEVYHWSETAQYDQVRWSILRPYEHVSKNKKTSIRLVIRH